MREIVIKISGSSFYGLIKFYYLYLDNTCLAFGCKNHHLTLILGYKEDHSLLEADQIELSFIANWILTTLVVYKIEFELLEKDKKCPINFRCICVYIDKCSVLLQSQERVP